MSNAMNGTRKQDGAAQSRCALATGSAPNWRMATHISGPTMRTLYRDDNLGVQMERWCKRREGNGPMGYEYYGGGVAYFIDRDKTEYKTEAAMMEALKPNAKDHGRLTAGDSKTQQTIKP